MKKNKFEEDLKNLEEWQNNQYNRGSFIGSGNIPRPILSLCKYPKLLIIIGILFTVMFILSFIYLGKQSLTFYFMFLAMVFLLGGFLRLKR